MIRLISRTTASNLGIYIYAFAAITLGILGLASGDFATDWQHVHNNVPHREALAYIVALCELLGGAAILWRQTARIGALVMTTLYSVFALLWVAQIFQTPLFYGSWGNFFEEFSLVIGGVVLYASLAPRTSPWFGNAARISRFFGICVVSFALEHFLYLSATVGYVPKWIPLGQLFWAVATGVFFSLAAIAILSGILSALAARLLTAMIIGFGILVWAPILFATPHSHFCWAGNAINLAIAASAWVVADSFSRQSQKSASVQEISVSTSTMPRTELRA